jgi:hypothetical protein
MYVYLGPILASSGIRAFVSELFRQYIKGNDLFRLVAALPNYNGHSCRDILEQIAIEISISLF